MKTRSLILASLGAAALAWPIAQVVSQMRRASPVQLRNQILVLVENHFDQDGSLRFSFRERMLISSQGALRYTRRIVVPPLEPDDIFNRILDLASNRDITWYNDLPRMNVQPAYNGRLTLADLTQDWASTKCGLTAQLNPAPSDQPGVRYEFLGEQAQYNDVLAFGTRSIDTACEACGNKVAGVKQIVDVSWRSPEFACEEVAATKEAVMNDGTVRLLSEKKILAAELPDAAAVAEAFQIPPGLQESLRADIVAEKFKRAKGREWPLEPAEKARYQKMVENETRRARTSR